MENAAADGDGSCHADELFNLGNKLDEEGRFEEAAAAYQQSASISEASSGEVPSDVLLNLGFALRSLGKLDQARAAWRRALRSVAEVRSRAVLLTSGGLCTEPEAVLKLAGVLRGLKIDATVLQGLLPASELHQLRFKSESECLSEVFASSVLAPEPWVRLLCIGEALPRAEVAAFAAEVNAMLDIGLLEEVLPGHLASGLQLYPFRGLALLTDWSSVTLGPPGDEPVMAIGTDSLELPKGSDSLLGFQGSRVPGFQGLGFSGLGFQGSGGSFHIFFLTFRCLALSPGDEKAKSDLSGLRVLDLCTGSGIAALHALRCGAEEAVAVDLSPRAASIAKANGLINDLGSRLTVCQGDLFEAIEGIADMRGFDLIVANPPFVAAPENVKASLYVHGGRDGLSVTRGLVAGACDHLESQNGTLVMIGEFPNLSTEALPPWLPDRPGWNHAAFYAEEHRQSAAAYAADRARPPASEPLWTSSLRAAGVEDMISALIVSSFDGSRREAWLIPWESKAKGLYRARPLLVLPGTALFGLPKMLTTPGLVWSFGCVTDSDGRNVLEPFLRKLASGHTQGMKEEFGLLCDEPAQRSLRGGSPPFPEEGAVFDFFPVGPSCKWEPWSKKIGTFEIPKDAQAHSLIVPTSDTVRNAFFLQMLIKAECHVLFAGPTGTGKTVVIQQQLLKGFDREPRPKKYNTFAFAFSAQSSANQTQDVIDGKLDKRKKGCYGPPFGKRCLVFVDDLNMPAKEKYGAQPPIELLRQWMDTSGWYERKTCEYRQLVDLNFIAALTPSAGRPQITARYLRHYNYFYVLPFEGESLHRIFQTVLQWYLAKFPSQVGALSGNVVRATVDIYHSISANMLPTPAKSHYTFNLRDLAKVNQGICLCSKESLPTPDDFIRCWVHECQRVFQDRLVNDEDNAWFNELLQEKLQEHFKKQWKAVVKQEPLIFIDFADSGILSLAKASPCAGTAGLQCQVVPRLRQGTILSAGHRL
ncbi:Dnah7 [Symbiodinium sp. CCMP2456]|nr:Dnah7 [Symbiodinium sp. CCMP2456]